MASIELTQATRDKINTALDDGPGTNNQNYRAAYDAIFSEISQSGGFNPGTVNWFAQAGAINQHQSNPSAAGTFIWEYTRAAAAAQGADLTDVVKFPRFRGHPSICVAGVHNGKKAPPLHAGVSASDDRAGSIRAKSGESGEGV